MGGKRKTIADYKKINMDKDRMVEYILSYIPKDTKTNIENGWKCMKKNCGYIWRSCYDRIYNGKGGCPNCAGHIKKTIEDYRKINSDKERMIEYILSYIPKRTIINVEKGWKCKIETCGHIWSASYQNIYISRTGCPKCVGNIPKTIEDYKKINTDDTRMIEYIKSVIPINTHISVENGWRCRKENCNHIWGANYSNIYSGKRGCPKCYKNSFKTIEDYKKINSDKERMIEYILSYIPKTTNIEIKNAWRCKKENCGHIWTASYRRIYTAEQGCLKCLRKSLRDYKRINTDEKRMIEYIRDDIPKNTKTGAKDGWKCKKENCGHIWSASYIGIYLSKSGCPRCSSFKSEKQCREIFEIVMGNSFNKQKPKFLKGLEYDGYNENLKLAFEFNGVQHYKYHPHFHKDKEINFKEQIERDKLKIKLSIENNVQLIIVPYTYNTYEGMKLFIKKELYRRNFYREYIIDRDTLEMFDVLADV